MNNAPVVVTNSCADACAADLGLPDRETARAWLQSLIYERGQITADLPPPMRGRRSPSGYFCLIDGMLVLPLAADRQGRAQWIATSCQVFPEYLHRYRASPDIDPFTLTGAALLSHVNFTEHAVRRFQERCGAHPDLAVATQQLAAALGPGVRATRRPPRWCRTQPADLFLVAGDEFCLPASTHGSRGKAIDIKTCIHRASDLFALHGRDLAARTQLSPDIPAEGRAALADAFNAGGSLSWTRPLWANPEPSARFWVLYPGKLAAPAAWNPDAGKPLTLLALTRHRNILARLLSWAARAGRR
jgi:hypothetical protein